MGAATQANLKTGTLGPWLRRDRQPQSQFKKKGGSDEKAREKKNVHDVAASKHAARANAGNW